MKRRYLDLSPAAGKFLFLIGAVLILTTGVLFALSVVMELISAVLKVLCLVSLFTGLGLLAVFVLLVAYEQIQDFFRFRSYRKLRNRKLRLENGGFECSSCGSRSVGSRDIFCSVCGVMFVNPEGEESTRTD